MSFDLLISFACNKHPTYTGQRKPTAKCQDCKDIYALRQDIGPRPREVSWGKVVRAISPSSNHRRV
jgi:hypothetical protein